MDDWSAEALKELIKKYKRQRVLWDLSHINFTSRTLRKELEEKIAKKLQALRPETTAVEVRDKFRMLHGRFLMEQKMIAETSLKSEWWCYKRLEFLASKNSFEQDGNESVMNSSELPVGKHLDNVYKKVLEEKRRKWLNENDRDQQRAELVYIEEENPEAHIQNNHIQTTQNKSNESIKLAEQFNMHSMTQQKSSKNLTFANFIADELDNINCQQLLEDTKWDIQQIIRAAQKQQRNNHSVIVQPPVTAPVVPMSASTSIIDLSELTNVAGVTEEVDCSDIQTLFRYQPSEPVQLDLEASLLHVVMGDEQE